MIHRKRSFKAFGLTLLAAVGLMVFIAASAQANWLYLEGGVAKELTENELVEVTKHSEDGTLSIEGVNLEILCKTITGEEVKLEPGNATTANASGKVAFGECVGIEKSTGREQKNCNPINQPIKIAAKAHIVLHTNGQNYFLFEPEAGKPFTTIEFSELCALVETSKVTGTFVAECGELNAEGQFVQEDCKNHQVAHLLRMAPEALFPSDVLKYGSHKSIIRWIIKIILGALRRGASWSGEV